MRVRALQAVEITVGDHTEKHSKGTDFELDAVVARNAADAGQVKLLSEPKASGGSTGDAAKARARKPARATVASAKEKAKDSASASAREK